MTRANLSTTAEIYPPEPRLAVEQLTNIQEEKASVVPQKLPAKGVGMSGTYGRAEEARYRRALLVDIGQTRKLAILTESLKKIPSLGKGEQAAAFHHWVDDVFLVDKKKPGGWPQLEEEHLATLIRTIFSYDAELNTLHKKMLQVVPIEHLEAMDLGDSNRIFGHNESINHSIGRLLNGMPSNIQLDALSNESLWHGISHPVIEDPEYRLASMKSFFRMVKDCVQASSRPAELEREWAQAGVVATAARNYSMLTHDFNVDEMHEAIDMTIDSVENLKSTSAKIRVMRTIPDVSAIIFNLEIGAANDDNIENIKKISILKQRLLNLVNETDTHRYHQFS